MHPCMNDHHRSPFHPMPVVKDALNGQDSQCIADDDEVKQQVR